VPGTTYLYNPVATRATDLPFCSATCRPHLAHMQAYLQENAPFTVGSGNPATARKSGQGPNPETLLYLSRIPG
jgi:hypothetical protein